MIWMKYRDDIVLIVNNKYVSVFLIVKYRDILLINELCLNNAYRGDSR